MNRPTQVTDAGGGYVTYTYNQNDVLQAVGPKPSGENLKQRQLEYDGLGRLTKVCELTSGPGYGVCGMQGSSPNGYLTTYTYSVVSGYPTVTVTQNAQASSGQQTRVYTYDLLGRLVTEANPETNNLLKTYTYDSDSSGVCSGTYNGDLVKYHDPKGNVACYQYDLMHRITMIAYPSGPDAASTPAKYYSYDVPWQYPIGSGTNLKGRMVVALTCQSPTSCAGNSLTHEEFGYSARGELTDIWSYTPHSNGNYHISASYWAHGALNQLSGIPSVPTLFYGYNGLSGPGLDGEGRYTRVAAATGPDPVPYNSITYTNSGTSQPIGSLAQVTYGSGDSDSFGYDPNTGREKSYVFNVNGATDTGQTTWNTNGSLGGFQVTDNVPGTSDTQKCSFTHDDLSRISSVNCANGSTNVWNQQFTYDAFGNIKKNSSGPGGIFQPTYSSSTNWITALPGCTPATDSNGQMTNDCAHNYTWDADGKMHSVDSTTVTRDALGRMVEMYNGSTYTDFLFSPTGARIATMQGQTLVHAFFPLPGGSTVVYNSSGIAYYRHADHLGSSRLATTQTRTLYSSTAYSPYGETYAQSGTTDPSFTGVGQDLKVGLYDFQDRENSAAQGRWLSPDPAGIGAVNPAVPQTWNRYAYVNNSPLAAVDPLGLCPDDAFCVTVSAPYLNEPGGGGGPVLELPFQTLPDEGGGSDPAFLQALLTALNALRNPNCARVVDGGTGAAASALLQSLNPGIGSDPNGSLYGATDPIATITPGNLGPATTVTNADGSTSTNGTAAQTQPSTNDQMVNGVWSYIGPTGPSTITINSNPQGAFLNQGGFLGYNNQIAQAITILHELGHAAAFAGFPGNIQPDVGSGGSGDPAVLEIQDLYNSQQIADNCFAIFGG